MSSKLPKPANKPSGKIPVPDSKGKRHKSRNTEVAKQNIDDLVNRKVEAEYACKNLEDNLKVYEQKILSLVQMKELEDLAFEEKNFKRVLLKARSSLCCNQFEICKKLEERAEKINQKLACKLTDEVSLPEQSFIFNPNTKKLESSIKSSLRRCLESDDDDATSQLIFDLVKKFSCQERLKHIMEIQNEVKNEVSSFVESINIDEDALKLSQELGKLEIGHVALLPLEHHIKDFTIKHARTVLEEQDLIHEHNKLERQLQELLQNNPDMTDSVQEIIRAEQSEVLHKHLESLGLDNHNFHNNELEQERTLKKILNLNKELEELRFCVMKDLSSMESISTHQQKLVDDMHEIDKSCVEFGKMLEIEKYIQTLIKNLYMMPLKSTEINCNSPAPQEVNDSADMKALLQQLEQLQKHEVKSLQTQTDAFSKFKGEMSKHNEVLKRDAMLVQKTACEAQNLYLEHTSAPKDFVEKLEYWKENPVEKKLALDSTRSVNDLTLQEWIDLFIENYPEVNCISE